MSHRCAKYVPHLTSPLERVMQVRKDRRPYRLRPLSAYHVIPAQAGIQGCAGAPPRPRGTRGSAGFRVKPGMPAWGETGYFQGIRITRLEGEGEKGTQLWMIFPRLTSKPFSTQNAPICTTFNCRGIS